MFVTILYNDKNQPIGWEMSGENPAEIKKLGAIRDLTFWGYKDTAIKYDGRKNSDDANNNPGVLTWKQAQHTSSYKKNTLVE
jgi:hypothetical protein